MPALLVVVAAGLVAFLSRRRWPLLAFALCWFFGGHVMESGPVALELYKGVTHDFIKLGRVIPEAALAQQAIAEVLRAALYP